MLDSAAAFEAVGNFTSHRVSCDHAATGPRPRKGGLLQVLPLERTLSMLAVASNETGSRDPILGSTTVQSARAHGASDHDRGCGVSAPHRIPLRQEMP